MGSKKVLTKAWSRSGIHSLLMRTDARVSADNVNTYCAYIAASRLRRTVTDVTNQVPDRTFNTDRYFSHAFMVIV